MLASRERWKVLNILMLRLIALGAMLIVAAVLVPPTTPVVRGRDL
jgi:hypothetical protein